MYLKIIILECDSSKQIKSGTEFDNIHDQYNNVNKIGQDSL